MISILLFSFLFHIHIVGNEYFISWLLIMRWKVFLVIFLYLFWICFIHSAQANTWDVTRDGLILEYLFNDGKVIDTSWKGRIPKLEGTLSFWTQQIFNLDYIDLSSGKIKTNLWWSSDGYGEYTISFWLRWVTWDYRNYKKGIVWSDAWNLLSLYKQYSDSAEKCFANKRYHNHILYQFPCEYLFDDTWHHVIIRKNGKYNKIYIDDIKVYDKDGNHGSVGYDLNIDSYSDIAHFRVYDRSLSSSERDELYNELRYVQLADWNSYREELFVDTVNIWDVSDRSSYSFWFDVQTLVSQRWNEANKTKYNYGKDDTQTLFSANHYSYKDGFNLTLKKDYTCGTPAWEFDCSILRDEQQHNFLITYNGSMQEVYIDGTLVNTGAISNMLVGGSLSMKNSPYRGWSSKSSSTTYFGEGRYCRYGFVQNTSYICYNKSGFLGNITNFKLYNGAVGERQREEEIFLNYLSADEREIYSSISSLDTYIVSLTPTTLTFVIAWVGTGTSKEDITYEYSFGGTGFISVSSGELLDYSDGYKLSIDIESLSYGENDISLYVNNGKRYLLSKFNFNKENNVFDIVIVNPDSWEASSKTVTASVNNGILTYAISSKNICNSSINTSRNYIDLTFTSINDNGKRVCYKAVDNETWKIVYKISDEIRGIVSSASDYSKSIFDNYTSWKYSDTIRHNDTTFTMLSLIGFSSSINNSNRFAGGTNGGTILLDVNGDGLVDLLHNAPDKKAILVNNGDYTFTTVYKCVIKNGYYGNCAQE